MTVWRHVELISGLQINFCSSPAYSRSSRSSPLLNIPEIEEHPRADMRSRNPSKDASALMWMLLKCQQWYFLCLLPYGCSELSKADTAAPRSSDANTGIQVRIVSALLGLSYLVIFFLSFSQLGTRKCKFAQQKPTSLFIIHFGV